jgi:hypothetical protein
VIKPREGPYSVLQASLIVYVGWFYFVITCIRYSVDYFHLILSMIVNPLLFLNLSLSTHSSLFSARNSSIAGQIPFPEEGLPQEFS